jgi:hypothetical protein
MIRKILLLSAFGAAALTLAGCGPSSGILATAKTGDCFNVTGKDAMGQPKLIHSDCPTGPATGQSTLPPAAAADQAAADAKGPPASTPATSTTATAAATPAKTDVKAVCQPVAPACAVPAKSVAVFHARPVRHGLHVSASRYTHALNSRRVWRSRKVLRHRHGHAYTETVTEYVPASGEVTTATIGAPYSSTTELAGGSSREDSYTLRDHPVYAPPPYGPPAYGPPPPPPPPPADARRYEHHETRGGYDARSYDSRSSSSQSYSSSTSVQRSVPPPRPCNCTTRPTPAYEPDGYLTWPNKSQY